jgi:folate-binding Fe-S cluster repair protein YgfZ
VLYDVFLHKSKEQPDESLILECDERVQKDLIAHLEKYRLRNRVQMTPLSDAHVLFSAENNDPDNGDPRLPTMGSRLLTFSKPSGATI